MAAAADSEAPPSLPAAAVEHMFQQAREWEAEHMQKLAQPPLAAAWSLRLEEPGSTAVRWVLPFVNLGQVFKISQRKG